MMKRQRRHHALHGPGRLVPFELDPLIVRPLRGFGVDPYRLIAGIQQSRDKAAHPPAANLQHRRQRWRQLGREQTVHSRWCHWLSPQQRDTPLDVSNIDAIVTR